MIEADVVEHGDLRAIKRNRPIAFIDLADKRPLAYTSAGEWNLRGDEVLHHRAVHDRRIETFDRENPAEHGSDGRLAAGSRDRDSPDASVEQRREQLGAGHPREAELGRS